MPQFLRNAGIAMWALQVNLPLQGMIKGHSKRMIFTRDMAAMWPQGPCLNACLYLNWSVIVGFAGLSNERKEEAFGRP